MVPPRESGRAREREREKESPQSNRWAVGWTAHGVVSIFLIIPPALEAGCARRGNVVTGNGTTLRRCSPDGRTNVRVLLFQLCGLPVLRLAPSPSIPPRRSRPVAVFAPPYRSATHVRVTVHVYRSGFFLFFPPRREIFHAPPVRVNRV